MALKFTNLIDAPVLVFGLVGPIGVDLEYAQETLIDELKSYNYKSELIHVTKLMDEIECRTVIDNTNLFTSYSTKIEYANELRKTHETNDLLAAVAISAIQRLQNAYEESVVGKESANKHGNAYIIRQLKTPDEIKLLRSVYGRQFIQVSLHGSPSKREDYLVTKSKIRSNGTLTEKEARQEAKDLIDRDRKEDIKYGQNISNAFPLGDVFVSSSDKSTTTTSIERFLKALFGSNEISPTREEYGMYLAKSASLRSSDLSRQVGAAIFSRTGEVISLGSNEVPKAGGGTYWTGDSNDSRDIQEGHDPNELTKVEIFADILNRLYSDKLLSEDLQSLDGPQQIVQKLLNGSGNSKYRDSRVMDLIEFGRIIHAEMSAICDAARLGISIKDGTLYCTTFPCHLCAKHIVASGVKKVVYLEPYPKSYAQKLHSDSIEIDSALDNEKVKFQPFIGISPFRYRDLFEKGKRKDGSGEAKKWFAEPRRPMIDVVYPSHVEAENLVIAELGRLIASKKGENSIPQEERQQKETKNEDGPIVTDTSV
ncbi:anti-phage dCTP deaminase [uncultured Methylobacterium sp.]|uniref:anti-phage dCTP deaminase n=1 Tax=uncultured Methylobacterium sp. TaxID=157278 RepID=UPI00259AB4C5|nr:anti-phage dCTP deaminase [uncultured Methylobacterium sp.]